MFRLFRVFIPVGTLTVLLCEFLLLSCAFVLACFIALPFDPSLWLGVDGGWVRLLVVILSLIAGIHFHDLYTNIRVQSRIVLLQQLCMVVGLGLLLQGFIAYVDPNLRVPIRVMVIGSFLSLGAVFAWRVFFSEYLLRAVGGERMLLVGTSPLLVDIAQHVGKHPEIGLEVAGYVSDPEGRAMEFPGGKVLGALPQLKEIVSACRPGRIVVGMFDRRRHMPMEELLELRFAGNIIEEAANVYERVCGRVCLTEIRPSQLIYSGELGPGSGSLMFQTVLNLVLASVVLILAFPIMLLTALAVRLSSPGPILYRQVRVGWNGRPFTLYKFRVMRVDVDAAAAAGWQSRDDPRVTRVGRFIRNSRLDQLPQLFNVLKGDMSLVGPEPERPEFFKTLAEKIPYYRQRLSILPGITGWAQIHSEHSDSLEDTVTKLEYDLYYIKNMTLGLDLYIIFHTVKTVLLSLGS
ncbi:MAG TPA: sugar transferase [Bryobacteraceae bacterium]|jgi:sugar transferase (PEP-CTERM system associated)|nr:sugar transferase [Bryobacteraceae bacterium]